MKFEPIGEKSRKDYALEVLRKHAVGEVVTYAEFAKHLGSEDRRVIQAAVRDAAKDFLRFDRHAVEAVVNKGYRIVDADDHVRLAEKQRKRSVKTLRKGEALVVSVDYNGMTPEARRLAEGMALGFGHLLEANRRMDARLASVERAQEAVSEQQEHTAEELDALKARLARLEGREEQQEGN